jgi:hypothetical protein
MEECAHRAWMPQLSAKDKRGTTPKQKKMLLAKIKLGMPVIVPGLLYKFQMIC